MKTFTNRQNVFNHAFKLRVTAEVNNTGQYGKSPIFAILRAGTRAFTLSLQ
ncbi:hypothetical protein [Sinomicrobium sp. M5D2P9]